MTDRSPITNLLENGIPFVHRCGLKVLELEPGRVKVLMPFEGNGNHIGTMYAGALFTLAEIPGGALFLSSFDATKFFPIVKDMQIQFKKPARTDVTAEFTLSKERVAELQETADRAGKCDFSLEGELVDANGEIVAISRGLYQIRKI